LNRALLFLPSIGAPATRDLFEFITTARRIPNCGFLTPPPAGFGTTAVKSAIKEGSGMTSEGDQFTKKIDKYTRNM
jgi:hypothetical protein